MTQAQFEETSRLSNDELGFDALHVPARTPGDPPLQAWYDVFPIGADRFAVAVGDFDPQAITAERLRATLRGSMNVCAIETGSLARAATAVFGPAGLQPSGVVGVIDCTEQTFTYLTAGETAPMVSYADGTVALLPGNAPTLDRSPFDSPLVQVVADLRDAAGLFLSSGEVARELDAGMLARLAGNLGSSRPTASLLAQRILGDRDHAEAVLVALTFALPAVTAAGERNPAPRGERPRWSASWTFDTTLAAANGVRRAFVACLDSKPKDVKRIDLAAAELIFGEMLGNVVRHAPGVVEITLDWTDDLPVLHMLDNGPGFVSRRVRERLPNDDLSESGRGLFIINAYAVAFSVRNRSGRGTHACATLPHA